MDTKLAQDARSLASEDSSVPRSAMAGDKERGKEEANMLAASIPY